MDLNVRNSLQRISSCRSLYPTAWHKFLKERRDR
jgi:hypothetical protein